MGIISAFDVNEASKEALDYLYKARGAILLSDIVDKHELLAGIDFVIEELHLEHDESQSVIDRWEEECENSVLTTYDLDELPF